MMFPKNKALLFIPVVLLIMGLSVSCKREIIPVDQVELGKDYYPLFSGHYIEYEVDSLRYNNFTQDTEFVHLQYRDEVTSQFTDDEGRDSYVIERSIRYNPTDAWEKHLIYYATMTNFRLEVVENNLRFIKMIYPVKLNSSWKGNIYIPAATSGLDEIKWFNDWDYRYKGINTDFDNGLINYPNSVSISYSRLTNDSTNSTQYSDFTNYKEAYSKQVGLIYRELTHWEFQPTEGFRNGFSMVMRATNHN